MSTKRSNLIVIDSAEAARIIDERQPLGLYYLLDGDRCIGIDNTTGDAWTEEFADLQQCEAWLQNPFIEIEWSGENG